MDLVLKKIRNIGIDDGVKILQHFQESMVTGSADTVKICAKHAAFGAGKDHRVVNGGKGGFEMPSR